MYKFFTVQFFSCDAVLWHDTANKRFEEWVMQFQSQQSQQNESKQRNKTNEPTCGKWKTLHSVFQKTATASEIRYVFHSLTTWRPWKAAVCWVSQGTEVRGRRRGNLISTVDGSENQLTCWGWWCIPLFTRFYTSQVVIAGFLKHQQYGSFWYDGIPCWSIGKRMANLLYSCGTS